LVDRPAEEDDDEFDGGEQRETGAYTEDDYQDARQSIRTSTSSDYHSMLTMSEKYSDSEDSTESVKASQISILTGPQRQFIVRPPFLHTIRMSKSVLPHMRVLALVRICMNLPHLLSSKLLFYRRNPWSRKCQSKWTIGSLQLRLLPPFPSPYAYSCGIRRPPIPIHTSCQPNWPIVCSCFHSTLTSSNDIFREPSGSRGRRITASDRRQPIDSMISASSRG